MHAFSLVWLWVAVAAAAVWRCIMWDACVPGLQRRWLPAPACSAGLDWTCVPPCGLLGAGTCWATRWTLASTPAWPKAGGRRGAASCTWSAPPPLSASCRAWWLTSWAPSSPEMSLKCRYLLPFLSFSLSLSPLSALYFLLFVHFLCRACFQCPISLK